MQQSLSELQTFYDYFSKEKEKTSDYKDIKILTKPIPGYNNLAKRTGTQGVILLAVLFDASGKVGQILVLKGLPNGLNENAINAARKIQFESAKENGESVSTVKRIQYNFKIF